MRLLIASVAALGLTLSGAAFAQTSGGASTSSGSQAAAPSGNQRTLATAQKIKQDLQTAGFQDVNVVAESFVVQAKTKDGDPVVMTIGPHGMTVFEAMNPANAGNKASTTGTTSGSSSAGSLPAK